MARQVVESLVDDLDGSSADETVELSLDGKQLEIDLNAKNARRLRDALAPFIAAARRAGGPGRRSYSRTDSRTSPASSRRKLPEARAWLRDHGYPVSDRGRINAEFLKDYENKSPNPPTQGAAEGIDQPTKDNRPANSVQFSGAGV